MKTILFASLVLLPLFALAQVQSQGPNQGQSQSQGTLAGASRLLERDQTCLNRTLVDSTYPPSTTGAPTIVEPNISSIRQCLALKRASAYSGEDLSSGPEQKSSSDGKITCVRKAGYTVDYTSCSSALNAYNQILILESALLVTQQVRTNNSNQEIAQDVNTRVAEGDGQNAVLDASISTNRQLSSMNQEQAVAYTAAVTYLGAKIAGWVKTELASLQAKCPTETQTAVTGGYQALAEVPSPNCKESLALTYGSARSDMIANSQAKSAFVAAAVVYAAKGIAAGIKAAQLSALAKATEAAKTESEATDTDATLADCTTNPYALSCLSSTTSTTTSSGTLADDGGFTATEFGASLDDTSGTSEDLTGTGGSSELDSVSDVSSPFAEDAKKASGILDPAAAASASAASPAGAGGAAAPSVGGGGASLGGSSGESGTDEKTTQRPEETRASYAPGSGGFVATKGVAQAENPFANLFKESSGSAGLREEDASIDSAPSNLFQKISTRYGRVLEQHRIEAMDLSE